MIFAVPEEIVYVAADLAGRAQSHAYLQALDVRSVIAEQQRLQLAGGFEVGIHSPLAVGDLFVEPGVFHRTGDLRRQQR